jgi:hypothetical protein
MTDERLKRLAQKYGVDASTLAYLGSGGPQTVIDRKKIIDALLVRDTALRANVSVIAAGITILSTIFNVVWTLQNAR